MKGKKKYILKVIIILNISYLFFFYYNVYFKNKINIFNHKIEKKSTNISKQISMNNQLEYNYILSDYKLIDILGNEILITKKNSKLKYIEIIQTDSVFTIELDYLISFNELIKEFDNNEIISILIIMGNIPKKQKDILLKIQKKLNGFIVISNKEKVHDYFKLSEIKYDIYCLILDKNNNVRFSGIRFDLEIMKRIIQNEIRKNSLLMEVK
ncbi:hypothetical protein AMJ80_01120 [bacterium SM23_31]|nr:MAG: hypothetical protein AMJ80_01120 [bacterium SM23_31]